MVKSKHMQLPVLGENQAVTISPGSVRIGSTMEEIDLKRWLQDCFEVDLEFTCFLKKKSRGQRLQQ